MSMDLKWIHRYLNAAQNRGDEFSKDPSTKVGCVIVAPDGKEDIKYGYNGFPKGVPDISLDDREHKYPRTIHAEINAIIKAKQNLDGCYLLTSLAPCSHCAAVIIQSGIKHVYHIQQNFESNSRWFESHMIALDMFEAAGVGCTGVYTDDTFKEPVTIPEQRFIVKQLTEL